MTKTAKPSEKEVRLKSGKYKGRLLKDVLILDNAYIRFLVRTKRLKLPKHMKE